MDIGNWANFVFIFGGFWEVYNKRDSPDVNASSNCLSTQKDLYLSISESLYSGCLGLWAVLWAVMLALAYSAFRMDVVYWDIVLSF